MEEITRRISACVADVESRIAAACARAHRGRETVRLICVTKTRSLDEIRVLYEMGYREFGESRVQDLRQRAVDLPDDIVWHLIGSLQTNKAKYLPGVASWIHSIDRTEVADAVARAWEKSTPGNVVDGLLQVNISGEEQKHGAGDAEAVELLLHSLALKRLRIRGLMCMAPLDAGADMARRVFAGLRNLRDQLQRDSGAELPELSMGMSGDFEGAIEEGATMIRVGTALFQ